MTGFNFDKIAIIDLILAAMTRRGQSVTRSACGRYIYIDHGANSFYDDLKFFIRQWHRGI